MQAARSVAHANVLLVHSTPIAEAPFATFADVLCELAVKAFSPQPVFCSWLCCIG
jgi:hypothetical protein